jgi:hypothetical protein
MKSAQVLRLAKRMSAAAHAALTLKVEAARATREAQRQARQDAAEQLTNPVPEFEAAPRLTMLPGGLHWSAQQPVPAVGKLISAQQGGKVETVKVLGYCHAAGFIGLVTQPYHPGSIRAHRMHPRAHCVFGSQLVQAA